MDQTLYQIFGVDRSASEQEIKQAFKTLAKANHPDTVQGDVAKAVAEEKFKQISAAYEVLSDAGKRQKYDAFIASGQNGPFTGSTGAGQSSSGWTVHQNGGGIDWNAFSSQQQNPFGVQWDAGAARNMRGGAKIPNTNTRVDINVTLKETLSEQVRVVEFDRITGCPDCQSDGGSTEREVCKQCGGLGMEAVTVNTVFGAAQMNARCSGCHGRGKTVKDVCKTCHGFGCRKERVVQTLILPVGSGGRRLDLPGAGNLENPDLPAGDLYVFVSISEQNSRFQVQPNLNVTQTILIDPLVAMVGGEINVPLIDDTIAKVALPEGTPHGFIVVIPNQGLYTPSRRRADMQVVLKYQPRILTEDQKAAIRSIIADSDSVVP